MESLFLERLAARADRVEEKLREHLKGVVEICITNRDERYTCDWSGTEASVSKEKAEKVDCKISLDEKNLMRLSKGVLNPQIAMLSDKVDLEGDARLAIYFFNVLAGSYRSSR